MARQLIIAGFHRSGTSLLAALLDAAGLPLGEDLLEADSSNRRGHFEDLEILDFHERVLAHFGYTWATAQEIDSPLPPRLTSEMADLAAARDRRHSQWGFKDPRVCVLLEAWRSVIPEVKVLIVFRDPAAACQSLVERERNAARSWWRRYPGDLFRRDPEAARRSWRLYNSALVSYAERHPEQVLALSTATLVEGSPVVRELQSRWGFDLAEVPIGSVYEPGLMRPSPASSERAPAEAEIWERLTALESESIGARS